MSTHELKQMWIVKSWEQLCMISALSTTYSIIFSVVAYIVLSCCPPLWPVSPFLISPNQPSYPTLLTVICVPLVLVKRDLASNNNILLHLLLDLSQFKDISIPSWIKQWLMTKASSHRALTIGITSASS